MLEEGEASALAAEAIHEALLGALEQRSVPGLDDLFASYEVKKVKEWTKLLVGDTDRLDRFVARKESLDPAAQALVDFALIARARVERRLTDAGALDFDRMIVWTGTSSGATPPSAARSSAGSGPSSSTSSRTWIPPNGRSPTSSACPRSVGRTPPGSCSSAIPSRAFTASAAPT